MTFFEHSDSFYPKYRIAEQANTPQPWVETFMAGNTLCATSMRRTPESLAKCLTLKQQSFRIVRLKSQQHLYCTVRVYQGYTVSWQVNSSHRVSYRLFCAHLPFQIYPIGEIVGKYGWCRRNKHICGFSSQRGSQIIPWGEPKKKPASSWSLTGATRALMDTWVIESITLSQEAIRWKHKQTNADWRHLEKVTSASTSKDSTRHVLPAIWLDQTWLWV